MRKLYAILFAFLFMLADSFSGLQAQTISITGTSTTLSSSLYGPMYTSSGATTNRYNRHAFIYPSSLLTGMDAGAIINSLAFERTGTAIMNSGSNFKIYLMNTNIPDWGGADLNWATAISGATLVYDSDPASIVGNTAGWKTFPLSTSFMYSGGNLGVLVEFSAPAGTHTSTTISWRYQTATGQPAYASPQTQYTNSTTALPDDLATSSANHPHLQINYTAPPACTGTPTPGNTQTSATLVCDTEEFTLNSENTTTGSGVTYQWQSSPNGSTWSNINGATNSSFSTTQTSTTFYRVIVTCSGADGISTPVQINQNIISAPTTSVETFDNYLPNICWREAQGKLDVSTTFTSTTSSIWTQDEFANVTTPSNQSANVLVSSTGRDEWLITPSYNLGTGGNLQLEFDLALTGSSNTNTATLGSDDKFVVLISKDNGATWSSDNNLRQWDVNSTISNTGEHIVIDLSSFSGIVKFAFYIESTVANETSEIFVDNFAINTIPSCSAPTSTTVSNVTNKSARIDWTPPTPVPVSYDVYFSTTNTAPDGTATPTATGITNTYYELTGLSGNTSYYFWVKSDCGNTNSDWISLPASFTTECDPISVPTSSPETFDTFLPNICWTEAQGALGAPSTLTGTTSLWLQDDFGNVGDNKSAKLAISSTSTTTDEWLITQSYDLGTGGNYQLEFDLALTGSSNTNTTNLGADDKFVVLISTDNGATWTSVNILRQWNSITPISNTGDHVVIDISSYSGIVKFAFYAESTASSPALEIFVDNVAVKAFTPCAGTPTPGTITAGSSSICQGGSETLTLSGHSTDGGITYEWESSVDGTSWTSMGVSSTSVIVSPTTTTIYRVKVTCPSSAQIAHTTNYTLTVNSLPTITVTPATSSICGGNVQELTASGADTYTWSPTTNLYTDAGATTTYSSGTLVTTVYSKPTTNRTYTVTGTDANGCINTATATISYIPGINSVSATATALNICQNSTTQLNAVVDYYNYSVTAISHNPIPTPGSGVTVLAENGTATTALNSGSLDNGRWNGIAIPFAFNFYGSDFTTFNISTNGFLSFSSFTTTTGYNQTIPSTTDPDNGIHIVNANLDLGATASPTGKLEYFTEGTAPNRTFVINYTNVGFATPGTNTGTVTVQTILYESSNLVEIHTTSVTNTTVVKTQGVEGPLGTIATAVPGRNNVATWTGMPDAYRFEPVELTYKWLPATYLDNPNIKNPTASNVASTITYTVTVTDPVTACSLSSSVTIQAGETLTATANANLSEICAGNSVILTAKPLGGGTPYTYSWSDGSNVVSTDSIFTTTPTDNTTYTLTISDACSQQVTTAPIVVNVINPVVLSTTPGSRCDAGTVTLTGSASTGHVLNWYSSPTGGDLLHTGSTFTTPSINSTSTYYVGASTVGASGNVGPTSPASLTGISSNTVAHFLKFDVLSSSGATISTVDIFPTSAIGSDFNIVVQNANGDVIYSSGNLKTTVQGTTTAPVAQTVVLNAVIPTGTGYRLGFSANPGMLRNTIGASYPYTISNLISVTGNTFDPVYWYYFYNINVTNQCHSSRTAVTATINSNVVISTDPATQTVCTGENVTFNVASTGAGTLTYQWRKGGTDISGATSDSYTITGVASGDAADYDVIVSNACGVSDTSALATLTVNPVTVITTEPTVQTVCAGSNATFSVAATGTGTLTYQWRKGGTDITGATSDTYTITGTVAGDAGDYDVIVMGSCGNDTSAVAVLTVNPLTVITTEPTTQAACTGSNATFTVTATGTGTLTYKWRKGGTDITGATSASYSIAGVSAGDAADYDVIVMGSCGNDTSAVAALTINPLTDITVDPTTQTVCAGSNVTFTTTATGSGTLTYKWRKGGTDITGATSASYTITGVAAGDAGNYDVIVMGGCGNDTSAVATLSVTASGTWTGTTSTDWNTSTNWCGGLPTATSDIIIPSGVTNMPVITTGTGTARNITINTGATLTVGTGGMLEVYGNYTNNGTMTATNGSITFRGAANQNVNSLSAANIIMNGAGGITLIGDMTVGTALTLTDGNITLGNNNLTMTAGTTGSTASHIITNGSGAVTINNGGTASVTFPIAPNATSYNPVMVANGSGRNFTASVATGITPTILNTARAINRTWNVTANTTSTTAANITFGYADADANASVVITANMEVGVHNGSGWLITTHGGGVAPTGTAALRMVTTETTLTGPFVVANVSFITALINVDADVTSVQLMPNVINDKTVLRVIAKRSMKINWTITDGNGKQVMMFDRQVLTGQNDLQLNLSQLASGTYYMTGKTEKGKTMIIKFVRL